MSTTIQKQILIGTLNIFTGPEKWLKRSLNDGKGGFCLLGGIIQSAKQLGVFKEPDGDRTKMYLDAWRTLHDHINETQPHSSIVKFNNADETSFEDMRDLLREVIQKVDA